MAVIQGSKVVFQVLIGNEYRTILCAKSINVRTEADIVETTTKGDGRFKDWDYDQLSASISLDAAHFIKNEEQNPVVLFDLADMQYQFMELNFRIIYTDSADPAKIYVFRAQGIVKTSNINASAGLVVDGSVEILIKGQWLNESALPEYVDFNIATTEREGVSMQVRVQLIDAEGNVIFDTAQSDQAVAGWLEHPFDVTLPVLVGDYYMIMEVRTETENNTWVIAPPPVGLTGAFDDGITIVNTFADHGYTPFNINRSLVIGVGNIVPPPPCVPPVIDKTPLSNAQVGRYYSQARAVTGTKPITLSNITKPAWMTITVPFTLSPVMFEGMPPAEDTNVIVAVDVSNNCGDDTFSDTIDVGPAPAAQSHIIWVITRGGISAHGTFRIYVNSVLVVDESGNTGKSGDLFVNPGDVVDIQLSPSGTNLSSLTVDDSVDGIIYQELDTPGFKTVGFTAFSGHNFDVIADVTMA